MNRYDSDSHNDGTESPEDVLNLLKSADPAGDPSSLLMPTRSRTALFKEITMIDTTAVRPTTKPIESPPLRPRLPRFLAPVAMAVVAIAVIAGVTVGGTESVSAQETVAQAAQEIGPVKAGQINVTVEADGITSIASYIFDSGSFDVSFGTPDLPESDGAARVIRIGDTDYTSIGFLTGPDEFIESPVGALVDDVDYDSILSLDGGDALDQARLLPVIEAAEDLEEISSNSDGTIYRGTVPGNVVESLDRSQLPAGFAALLTSEDYEPGLAPPEYGPAGYFKPDSLGETVIFEVLVQNGVISSVSLEIPGYQLNVTYAKLGQAQDVAVPANTITMAQAEQRFAELEG